MRADDDLLAAPWELHRHELFLVVLSKRRAEVVDRVGRRYRQSFDVYRDTTLEEGSHKLWKDGSGELTADDICEL